jgi:hypothetical protein
MVMKSVLDRADSAGMQRLCSLQNLSQDIIDIEDDALLGGMALSKSDCMVGSATHSGAVLPAASPPAAAIAGDMLARCCLTSFSRTVSWGDSAPEDKSFNEAPGDPAALIGERDQDCKALADDAWCCAWKPTVALLNAWATEGTTVKHAHGETECIQKGGAAVLERWR